MKNRITKLRNREKINYRTDAAVVKSKWRTVQKATGKDRETASIKERLNGMEDRSRPANNVQIIWVPTEQKSLNDDELARIQERWKAHWGPNRKIRKNSSPDLCLLSKGHSPLNCLPLTQSSWSARGGETRFCLWVYTSLSPCKYGTLARCIDQELHLCVAILLALPRAGKLTGVGKGPWNKWLQSRGSLPYVSGLVNTWWIPVWSKFKTVSKVMICF